MTNDAKGNGLASQSISNVLLTREHASYKLERLGGCAAHPLRAAAGAPETRQLPPLLRGSLDSVGWRATGALGAP